MILERVASGDESAIEDCVNAYGNVVWALARKSTRTTQDAETLVVKIFEDIWKYAERFATIECEEINFVALIACRRLNIHKKNTTGSF